MRTVLRKLQRRGLIDVGQVVTNPGGTVRLYPMLAPGGLSREALMKGTGATASQASDLMEGILRIFPALRGHVGGGAEDAPGGTGADHAVHTGSAS